MINKKGETEMKQEKGNCCETSVQHCNFIGVKWDGKALEAVNDVAKGLLNLTELFKSQGIKIDCFLKIGKEK